MSERIIYKQKNSFFMSELITFKQEGFSYVTELTRHMWKHFN